MMASAAARPMNPPVVDADGFMAIGFGMLAALTLSYAIGTLLLIAGIAISPPTARATLLLALGGGILIARAAAPGRHLWTLPAIPLLILLCIAAAWLIIDTSIDGQDYHFQATVALVHGWNPFYETYRAPADMAAIPLDPWPTHYPKASWIVSALIEAAGVPMEAAKASGFILIVIAALLTTGGAMTIGIGLFPALAIGVIAAANPVALVQLTTRMNDGMVSACFLIFIVLTMLWLRCGDRRALIMLPLLMAFALNLKFSVVPILMIFCLLACLAAWRQGGWPATWRLGLMLLGGGVLGVAVLGYAPYVQNLIGFGHPFHPVMGANAIDIIAVNAPATIAARSGPEAFVFSLFAATHSGFGTIPEWKLPFTLSLAEIRAASGVDTRLGGFGPLFSGALILSVLMAALLLTQGRSDRRIRTILLVALGVFATVLIMPDNWWARYIPQFWLIPVLLATGGLLLPLRMPRIAALGLLMVLALNAGLCLAAASAMAFQRDREARAQIATLVADGAPLSVRFGNAKSRLILFREAGLRIEPQSGPETMPCTAQRKIAGYGPDRQGGRICRIALGPGL